MSCKETSKQFGAAAFDNGNWSDSLDTSFKSYCSSQIFLYFIFLDLKIYGVPFCIALTLSCFIDFLL